MEEGSRSKQSSEQSASATRGAAWRATHLVSGSTKNTLSNSSARSLHFCEMSGRYTDPRVRSEMASESFWSWDWPWGWSQSGGSARERTSGHGLGDVPDDGGRCVERWIG
jgi:hypothetical protein